MRIGTLVGAMVLVVAACGGTAEEPTPASPSTASTPATTLPPSAPTSTTQATDTDPGLDLPRAAVYAHVVIGLTDAVVSSATPGTYLDDPPTQGSDRHLFIDLTMDFEDGYPGTTEEFAVADFSLRLADGEVIPAVMVDFTRTLRVTDDGPVVSALAFPADDLDLDGASVRFDDGDNVPLSIPLEGPIADPYPIPIAIDDSADVEWEGGCADAPGRVDVLAGEWDLDGGVDHTGREIVRSGSRRAPVGERFLRIDMVATAGGGNCGGTIIEGPEFRIVADGEIIEPTNHFVVDLDDGSSIDLVWGYRVPVDVTTLELVVGFEDGRIAAFPVPIPPELPAP
ncbi:MAG: hypothetical protein R3290_04100 [Acidimicrobiia bacterium]|nr:hypothetical protein [Acidimicrobiia bacterium]